MRKKNAIEVKKAKGGKALSLKVRHSPIMSRLTLAVTFVAQGPLPFDSGKSGIYVSSVVAV